MSDSLDPQQLHQIKSLIQATEEGINQRSLPPEVLQKNANEAVQGLLPFYSKEPQTYRRMLAAAYLLLGHAFRGIENLEAQRSAIANYDSAIALYKDLSAADFEDEDEINDYANAWTNRGIVHLNLPEQKDAEEALISFDKAIEWRKGLNLEQSDNYRWGLAAAWMNRADALTRMASEENLKKALESYDEAFIQLGALKPDSHNLYHNRLATAWMNRGMTAQALGSEEGRATAIASYDKAIDTLNEAGLADQPVHKRTLAAAFLNKGLLGFSAEAAALTHSRECANSALDLLSEMDDKDLVSADISLRARHLICRVMAGQMEGQSIETLLKNDVVTEASDIVDEAMSLARLWESRGLPHFRPVVNEIFQFGSRLYLGCQPHFLSEFLLENLDPEKSQDAISTSPDLHKIASEGVWFAALELEKALKASEGNPSERNGKLAQLLEELRATDQRLAALREQYLQGPAPTGSVSMNS